MKKVFKIVVNVLAWIVLVFALLVAIVVCSSGRNNGVANLMGYIPLTVESDSMLPTFAQGDMIICKEIERCKREGFDNERFDTIRKAYYGSIIQSFNSPDSIASLLNNTGLQGTGDAFSVMRTVASVTPEDVHEFLCERFDTANSSLFVVDPKQGAQS